MGYDIVDNILNSYTGSDKNVQVPFGLGLTGIAEEAFKNNTTIESVVVSSGITNIGAECFSGCTSLTSIYVPDDVVSVGINAFDGIDNLTVYCNEGSYIEEYCIANNISVNTDFDISDGVLNAYSGSEVNVIIPADLCVLKIGAGAFDRNYTIKSIVVPESVHTIGSSFMHCIGLESVVLPATVTAIEALAFLGCINLKNINIPIGIKTISGFAFARCSSLESIDLSNVETILYNAFDGCTNLGNITLGASLTSIGVDAFKDCSNLVINCYSDTYAHLYAVDNEIPYVLLDETSTTTFSLRSSADVDVLENNITSESLEEYVNCNPEEELYEYIQAEYNGEITEDNVDDVLTYIVNNR